MDQSPDQSPAQRLLALATERIEATEAATLALRKRAAMYRNPLLERPELTVAIALPLQRCLEAEKQWRDQQDALADEMFAALKERGLAAAPEVLKGLAALAQLAEREKIARAEYDAAQREVEQAKAEMLARLAD